jgi:hypothetical protein
MGITGEFAQIDYWNDNTTIAAVHPVSQHWKLLSNIDMSNSGDIFIIPPTRSPEAPYEFIKKNE